MSLNVESLNRTIRSENEKEYTEIYISKPLSVPLFGIFRIFYSVSLWLLEGWR